MVSKRTPKANYEVGFGRPPKSARFKPGTSGNPKGRPKKVPTLAEALLREADRTVSVQIGGKVQKMTKLEVLAKKTLQQAIDGNVQAMRLILPFLVMGREPPEQGAGPTEDHLLDPQSVDQLIDRLVRSRRSRS